uniref:Uncharacterized protein n=1 Tax=Pristionchus pacificus TaxID=54126 RepID=A0A2A6BI48_PRIPA|eukprot:PDM65574.1 hypothetical protein PRIPAC_52516 [Pristionchus pacificus]
MSVPAVYKKWKRESGKITKVPGCRNLTTSDQKELQGSVAAVAAVAAAVNADNESEGIGVV